MEEATFTIYAMGEAGWIHQILNAVAMTRTYSLLAFTGAIIGLIVMGLMVARDGSKAFTPQDFLVGVAIFTLFFGTRVDGVVVEDWQPDPITGYQQMYVVDNVPAGLAVLGTGLSSMGVYLAELFEQNFGDGADTVRASGGGYGHTLERFSRLRDLASASVSDPEGVLDSFRESSYNYLRDCTLKGIQAKEIKESEIYKANDPLAGIAYDHPWFVTEVVTQNGEREQQSCRDARGELALVRDKLPEALKSMSADKRMNGVGEIAQRFLAGTLGQSAVRMQDFMASLILSRLISSAAATNGGFGDSAMTMTAILEQASAQRNVQWVVEDSMFRRVLRPVVSFFEALCYALAPLAAFLFGLGRAGWSLAAKYLILPVWVVMFFPLVAITDAFGQRKFEFFLERYAEASQGLESGASSIAGMNEIMVNAMDAIGTSAMLGASVPALALMLLFGGAVTATHLAGRFQGGDFVDEKTAAPDAIKTAPVMGVEGRRDVNAFGSTMTAAAGGLVNYKLGNELRETTASADTARHEASDSYSKTLDNTLSELHSIGKNAQVAYAKNLVNSLTRNETLMTELGYTRTATGGWALATSETDSNSGAFETSGRVGVSVGGNAQASDVTEEKRGTDPRGAPNNQSLGRNAAAAAGKMAKFSGLLSLLSAFDISVGGSVSAKAEARDTIALSKDASEQAAVLSRENTSIGVAAGNALTDAVSATYADVGQHTKGFNVAEGLKEAQSEMWAKANAYERAVALSSGDSASESVRADQVYMKLVNKSGEGAADAFLDRAESLIGKMGLRAAYDANYSDMERVVGDGSHQGVQQTRAAALMETLRGVNDGSARVAPGMEDERVGLYTEMLEKVFYTSPGDARPGDENKNAHLEGDAPAFGTADEVTGSIDGLGFTRQSVIAESGAVAADARAQYDGARSSNVESAAEIRSGNGKTQDQEALLRDGRGAVSDYSQKRAGVVRDESNVNAGPAGALATAVGHGANKVDEVLDNPASVLDAIAELNTISQISNLMNKAEAAREESKGRLVVPDSKSPD